MPRDFDGSVIEYDDLLIEQAKNTKINILLLGPNTNTEKPGLGYANILQVSAKVDEMLFTLNVRI